MAPERCVSTVKSCYGAIVATLEQIYEESHEPEALGLSKILTRSSTFFTIYLLDFVLPQVSKLSKCLQSQQIDLTIIASLVDATLYTLEDTIQPGTNWILELQDVMDEIEGTIGIKFTTEDVTNFQSRVAKPFFMLLKENIKNRFSSKDVVSSFSVLDLKKIAKTS